jgi:hypothetical protein
MFPMRGFSHLFGWKLKNFALNKPIGWKVLALSTQLIQKLGFFGFPEDICNRINLRQQVIGFRDVV